MDRERATRTPERNDARRTRPLRAVAAVRDGDPPAGGLAADRAALLTHATDAEVAPVHLREEVDARGRRGYALVATDPGDASGGSAVEPELVVIAHGPQTTATRLFGTAAEGLARSAERPVLVVRLPAVRPYARVLVATDLSEASADAARFAARLAARGVEEVWLLHVLEGAGGIGARGAAPEERASGREAARRTEAALARVAAASASGRFLPVPILAAGEPSAEIERLLATLQVELLVVGKHAPSETARPLLGSVAAACLRDAPCDVLVVPTST